MMNIEMLIEGHEVSDVRKERLVSAIALGASDDVLFALRDAVRTSKTQSIVLPAHRYEGLSRGRGWCRKGKGDSASWGERVDDGYRVGPGRWSVGATDGFKRKDSTEWTVKHVTVGPEIWTVAD